MQVSVEATSGLERRMTVEVPAERIEQEVKTRLKSLAGKAKLDGFRQGKVPFNIVERKFAGRVRSEVMGDMISSTFQEALSQEKLRPAGGPKIETLYEQPEKGLGYTATFEVYPEIALAPLDKVTIDKPVVAITEQDIDNMLVNLRKQRPNWKPAERGAQLGDQLQIEFKTHVVGAESGQGPSQQTTVVLGTGALPKEVEEKLLGLSAGEETSIGRPASVDEQGPEGSKLIDKYTIKVIALYQADLPELDEAFAKSLGVESGTMEDLRTEVRGNMQRELDLAIKNKLKQQVMDVLLERNPVEIPKAPLDKEIDALIEQTKTKYKGQAPQSRADYEPAARRRVALGLIIGDIIRTNSIKADADKVRDLVDSLASTYEDSDEVVKWYYSSRERLDQVESLVLEDQVVDWVLERTQVSEKTSSFDALINPPQTAVA